MYHIICMYGIHRRHMLIANCSFICNVSTKYNMENLQSQMKSSAITILHFTHGLKCSSISHLKNEECSYDELLGRTLVFQLACQTWLSNSHFYSNFSKTEIEFAGCRYLCMCRQVRAEQTFTFTAAFCLTGAQEKKENIFSSCWDFSVQMQFPHIKHFLLCEKKSQCNLMDCWTFF